MSKLTVIAVGAAGYVLGARAGRERYEQIKQLATKVWQDPRTQSTVDSATTTVKDAAGTLKDKTPDAASKATDAVRDLMSSDADGTGGSHVGGSAVKAP